VKGGEEMDDLLGVLVLGVIVLVALGAVIIMGSAMMLLVLQALLAI